MIRIKRSLILVLSLLLSSCAVAVLAGAAGSYIVYDDRSMRALEKDARIFHVVHKALVRDKQLSSSHVNVTSFKQVVLLTGQTPYASARAVVEKYARQAPNVRRIYNEITIENPSSAWQRTQDTGITSNIRTHMLTKKDLESGAIRIVTENAVVYLMGDVSHAQADLAVNVARQVPGVQKVVKVFQYIDN
ncbi:MAG: BON domain-containing protein [Gammaproteobacteria bacterium]|nr:BON domain-containing protein [Gammaproteobacteria bacterium]